MRQAAHDGCCTASMLHQHGHDEGCKAPNCEWTATNSAVFQPMQRRARQLSRIWHHHSHDGALEWVAVHEDLLDKARLCERSLYPLRRDVLPCSSVQGIIFS